MPGDPSISEAMGLIEELRRGVKHAHDRIDALELRTAGQSERPPAPPDPALQALKVAMVAMFKAATGYGYVFDGAKDAFAIKRLIRMGDQPAVLQRWRANLMLGDRFPGTKSIAVFSTRFNSYVPAKPPAARSPMATQDPYK